MVTVAPATSALPDLSASTSSVASDAPSSSSSSSYGTWGDSSTSSLTAQARAAASALLVSQEDVILGSGWDYDAPATPRFAPHRATGGALSPAGTASPRSPVSLDEASIPADKHSDGSRSPSPGASSLGGSGLLIRSTKQGWDRSFEVHHDWPAPAVRKPDEVLVRNVTAGLNPVDFQSILYNFGIPDTPWVLGRDVMGVVEEVGSEVTEFTPGQRVWTCADSRDVRAGAYQSRSVSRSVHLSRLPDNITDDAGATLGTGLVTAAVCAFWFFNLPRAQSLGGGLISKKGREGAPSVAVAGEPDWILVYGGGAVTGQFIAQLAKLAGLKVAVVASPTNFAHLSSDLVGAHACVDRFLSAGKLLEEVKRITGGKLRYAMDCVGSSTAAICEAALRSTGAEGTQLICLAGNPKAQPGAAPKDGPPVKVHKISFSTTIYGDDVFASAVFSDLASLLESGELKPVRAHVIPDGLAGVRRGLESLRDGTAPSAKKLVVRIKDTPHAHFTNLGVRAEMCWNGVV